MSAPEGIADSPEAWRNVPAACGADVSYLGTADVTDALGGRRVMSVMGQQHTLVGER